MNVKHPTQLLWIEGCNARLSFFVRIDIWSFFCFREKTDSFMERREICHTYSILSIIFIRKEAVSWPEVQDWKAVFRTG